jgi:hypothetical protein
MRYTAHQATGIEASGKKGRRAEAEKIALEMLPGICFNVSNMTIIQYIKKFWQEDSPYFREHEKVYAQVIGILLKIPPGRYQAAYRAVSAFCLYRG